MIDQPRPRGARKGEIRNPNGRPESRPEGAKRWEVWVTDEEREKLKSTLSEIRYTKKEAPAK